MSTPSLRVKLQVFEDPGSMDAHLKGHPSARHALFVAGVPERFIGKRYSADSSVTLLTRQGGELLIRFGSSGLGDAVGVDRATGHVVVVIGASEAEPLFVNSSIEQFTQTVNALAKRFPYYGHEASDEEIDLVADELLGIIKSIDDAAALPDRYWSTFVDDARIGDLSTEAILAIGE